MSRYKGLFIAAIVILSWAASLVLLLRLNIQQFPWLVLPGVIVQTFLYTGIFITAHDSIHGTVVPRQHKVNAAIGKFCLFVYALFSFNKVREKHFDHHRFPGTLKDPDYHDGQHPEFWLWYLHFLLTYISWKQIVGMAIVFNILHHLLNIPVANLLIFWVAPALLSTLQLFYFGTYLPHREPKAVTTTHTTPRATTILYFGRSSPAIILAIIGSITSILGRRGGLCPKNVHNM